MPSFAPKPSLHSAKNRQPHLLLAVLTVLAAGTGALHAGPIPVPNGSFESQSGVGQPFGVNINIDSWQKQDRPAYFPESGFNGFYWVQTAGNFVNPASPPGIALNATGAQAAYILSFPGAGMFQDYDAVDWNGATHSLNASYQVGKSYAMTVGVFGESVNEGAILQLGLYYRNGLNVITPIGTPSTIVYHAADFLYADGFGDFNLIDFTATAAEVQASDPWAGAHIGLNIMVLNGDTTNQWVVDNVRLTEAPEPATLGLLAATCGGLLLRRPRARREG